jgi:hypothetical protein
MDPDQWNEGSMTEKYKSDWSVWRQDDNGNVFLVKNRLTEQEALKLVQELERKGHKQTYWAKEKKG